MRSIKQHYNNDETITAFDASNRSVGTQFSHNADRAVCAMGLKRGQFAYSQTHKTIKSSNSMRSKQGRAFAQWGLSTGTTSGGLPVRTGGFQQKVSLHSAPAPAIQHTERSCDLISVVNPLQQQSSLLNLLAAPHLLPDAGMHA